jgi:hypothetical protein
VLGAIIEAVIALDLSAARITDPDVNVDTNRQRAPVENGSTLSLKLRRCVT